MNGIVYYHLKSFFDYVGDNNARLYVSFRALEDENGKADSMRWISAFEDMQTDADGAIFQIGVWTEMPLLDKDYNISEWVSYVHSAVTNVNGALNISTDSYMPLNALLFPAIMETDKYNDIRYRNLPNVMELNMPFVSVVLGQEASEEVHAIQKENINNAPVSFMGVVMGCLALAYAEESIGYVDKFNLNKNDTLDNAELGFGPNGNDIDSIARIQQNVLSEKGYIIPTKYDAMEAGIYLSNDQTLSGGDYCSISRGRIIHKIRRIIRHTLLPYVHEHIYINPQTGYMSVADASIFVNSIINAIDQYMINGDGNSQIAGKGIYIPDRQNILENDLLRISAEIVLLEPAVQINIEETYTVTN